MIYILAALVRNNGRVDLVELATGKVRRQFGQPAGKSAGPAPPLASTKAGQAPAIALGPPGALPSIHAIVAVHMRREDRKHRETIEAIERHGPPPGWRG